MALTMPYMKSIIRQNGHLVLEGGETKEELTTALIFLRTHTASRCRKRYLGTGIDSLIPDANVITAPKPTAMSLKERHSRKRNVSPRIVDIRSERL